MSLTIWLTFIAAATVVLVVPGPTILFVVGQSLAHGRRVALPLACGVVLGDTICMAVSLLGLASILAVSHTLFLVIKLAGAVYLVFLGVEMVLAGYRQQPLFLPEREKPGRRVFREVLLITAMNPKGIVFFSAFMPLFIEPGRAVVVQMAILATTFLALALVNVLLYTLLAVRVRGLFRAKRAMGTFRLAGGLSLIGAGVYAATLDR